MVVISSSYKAIEKVGFKSIFKEQIMVNSVLCVFNFIDVVL